MIVSPKQYEMIVDEDPFPFHRFPNYPEKEKLLSYLTVNGEEPRGSSDENALSSHDTFRGEYGTNFPPPGLEHNRQYNFQFASHPPPGLPHPRMRLGPYDTPMVFSRSTASGLTSNEQPVNQSAYAAIDGITIEQENPEHLLTADDYPKTLSMGSPPVIATHRGATGPFMNIEQSGAASVEHATPTTDTLVQDLQVLELEELQPVTSGPLIVSSEDWTPQSRSGLGQHSSENSPLFNKWNTPDKSVSHKTSSTSLKSRIDDSES